VQASFAPELACQRLQSAVLAVSPADLEEESLCFFASEFGELFEAEDSSVDLLEVADDLAASEESARFGV